MPQESGGDQFHVQPDGNRSRGGYPYGGQQQHRAQQAAENYHADDIFVFERFKRRGQAAAAQQGIGGEAYARPEVEQAGQQEGIEVVDKRLAQRRGIPKKKAASRPDITANESALFMIYLTARRG
jgi:hypothetical protein